MKALGLAAALLAGIAVMPGGPPRPALVETSTRLLAAGRFHSFATGTNGSLWAWGLNEHGQLGDGSTLSRPVPVPSRGPGGVPLSLAAGETHSVFVTREGRVYSCGANDRGQLGQGGSPLSPTWTAIPSLEAIRQVACGPHHTYALRGDGSVWGWGDNRRGQVQPGGPPVLPRPVRISGLAGIQALAAGDAHGLALTSTGALWAWGDGAHGALGSGPTKSGQAPRRLAQPQGLVQVTAGQGFSLGLDARGTVWAWGRNTHGQLGCGDTRERAAPTAVPGLAGVVWLAAGAEHALARDKHGHLWSWGDNNQGQLGHSAPSYSPRPRPVVIPSPPDARVPWAAAPGGWHTLLTRPGAPIYAFGANDEGQLGDWSGQAKARPTATAKAVP